MLSNKVKSLAAASGADMPTLLDNLKISRSSYYRFSHGITDLRSEALVKILKELGLDIEKGITHKVNDYMGNSIKRPTLGEDIEQIFRGLSRTSKMTIVNAIVADAKKTRNASLQEPLSRLVEYKKHLKGRRANASGGTSKQF